MLANKIILINQRNVSYWRTELKVRSRSCERRPTSLCNG